MLRLPFFASSSWVQPERERRPVGQLLRNIVSDAVDGRPDRGQTADMVPSMAVTEHPDTFSAAIALIGWRSMRGARHGSEEITRGGKTLKLAL